MQHYSYQITSSITSLNQLVLSHIRKCSIFKPWQAYCDKLLYEIEVDISYYSCKITSSITTLYQVVLHTNQVQTGFFYITNWIQKLWRAYSERLVCEMNIDMWQQSGQIVNSISRLKQLVLSHVRKCSICKPTQAYCVKLLYEIEVVI